MICFHSNVSLTLYVLSFYVGVYEKVEKNFDYKCHIQNPLVLDENFKCAASNSYLLIELKSAILSSPSAVKSFSPIIDSITFTVSM